MQQPSNVYDSTKQGYKVYMTFGLVTLDELIELTALPRTAPWNQIKGEAVQLENHLGKVVDAQYLISLRGLTCSEIHSIRRVEFFSSVCLSQDEFLLQAARQLEENQAHGYFEHHCQKQVELNPEQLSSHEKHKGIKTVEDLKNKIIKEAARRGDDLMAGKAVKGEADDNASDSEENAGKKVQSGPRRFAETAKKLKSKPVARRAKGKQAAPNLPATTTTTTSTTGGAEAAVENEDDAGAANSLPHPDLETVVEELKQTPRCFLNLSTQRVFEVSA